MGRSEKVYPKAFSFKPERWITKHREIQTFDQYEFPVFQAGPRICLGKDLAIYEVKVLLVELLRRFRFEFPSRIAPKNVKEFEKDVTLLNGVPVYQPGIALSYKGELRLKIFRRS